MAKHLPLSVPLLSPILNTTMPKTGKATVVDYVATSSPLSQQFSTVGFSKYSGVLEFLNSIVLWVNFDSTGNCYHNNWRSDGTEITWYGGSKMHAESNVIKRLVKLGSKPSDGEGGVLLFCRFTEGSKSQPYVYLGRCQYVEHDVESHPVKFIWRLKDSVEMKQRTSDGDADWWKKFVDWGKKAKKVDDDSET